MEKFIGTNFETNTSKKGIFRTLLPYIKYDCSTPAAGFSCDNVFNDNTTLDTENFWKSNGEDAFFEVTLEKGSIHPTDGSIYSCNDEECIYNITILGIEEGKKEYQEICTFEGSQNYFKSKLNAFPCQSDKPFKTIRIKQRGPNDKGTNQMNLYLFDFYGFLSFGKCFQTCRNEFIIGRYLLHCIIISISSK